MSDERQSQPAGRAAEGGSETRQRIIHALKQCYDPEIPVDIWELGLIYSIEVKASNDVEITMTLTSPSCPVAESLPPDVERRVSAVDGVTSARVDVTWEPPWEPEMMSEAARLELNL